MPAGLRPWPHGVGRVVAVFDVDGRRATNGFWFLSPGGGAADTSWSAAIADQFVLHVVSELLLLNSAAAQFVACDVTVSSLLYAHTYLQVDPEPGAWTGAQAMATTCGLHLVGATRGRGTQSVIRIASCPDQFVTNTWSLSASGFANLRDHGRSFLSRFNEIVTPDGGTIELGTLHQVHNGAPRVPPLFDPATDVVPAERLCTIRRRLPRGVQVSPV